MIAIAMISLPGALASERSDQLKITLLNQDPDPVQPGEYVDLRFKIEKQGDGTFKNISFTLPETYPLSLDPSEKQTKNIGSWGGQIDNDEEYYMLHYKAFVNEDAKDNDYDLPVVMRADNFKLTKEFELRVDEDKEPVFTVGQLRTSPLKLYDDSDENKLDIAIDNIGDGSAKNVIAKLELPEGFEETYGYSTRESLGTIENGGSKIATYYIDIDKNMTPGNKKATINISYKEEDEDTSEQDYKSVELPFDIPIHGRPKFEVIDTEFTVNDIKQEDKVSVYVTVKNTGTKEAESVSFRIFKEASQPFEFSEKSDFIGHLEPGETGQGALTFTVDDDDAMAKKYILDSEVRGIYNDEVIVDDQTMSISIDSSKQESDLLTWKIPAIIVLVILIIVGYLAYRTGAYEGGKKTKAK